MIRDKQTLAIFIFTISTIICCAIIVGTTALFIWLLNIISDSPIKMVLALGCIAIGFCIYKGILLIKRKVKGE